MVTRTRTAGRPAGMTASGRADLHFPPGRDRGHAGDRVRHLYRHRLSSWTTALAVAGYALGANWQVIANGFHGPTYLIAAIALWRHARMRKAPVR